MTGNTPPPHPATTKQVSLTNFKLVRFHHKVLNYWVYKADYVTLNHYFKRLVRDELFIWLSLKNPQLAHFSRVHRREPHGLLTVKAHSVVLTVAVGLSHKTNEHRLIYWLVFVAIMVVSGLVDSFRYLDPNLRNDRLFDGF